MKKRIVALIDGENLVFRYQEMLKSGRIPRDYNVHTPDVFIWNHYFFGIPIIGDVIRVVYYTSAVGDSRRVSELRARFQNQMYPCGDQKNYSWQRLSATVFKKDKSSRKTKTIDMRICIDALTHTMNHNMDILYLASGDVDYVPLIEEVMRHGIRVNVFAFTDGCADSMQLAGDNFTFLDDILFEPKK